MPDSEAKVWAVTSLIDGLEPKLLPGVQRFRRRARPRWRKRGRLLDGNPK